MACFFPTAQAETQSFNVLYLNSYHRGYSWSDDIELGIREAFAASDKTVMVYSEYLDTRRFPTLSHLPAVANLLEEKQSHTIYDLIITSDNDAFDFAVRYRQRLFPDVPLVFCGYNRFTSETLRGIENSTGIAEAVDFRATIELALHVQPNLEKLVFVASDSNTTAKQNLFEVKTILSDYADRYQIEIINNRTLHEIEQRLQQLSSSSAVFIIGEATDVHGAYFLSFDEYGRRLAMASTVPTYSMWHFYLNTGVLGGHILTGVEQGRSVVDKLVLPILNGESVADLPVITQSPALNIFDYQAMQRFGISETALPDGSVIINKPPSLYQQYRSAVWGAGIGFVFLFLMLAILTGMLRHLRHSNRKLRSQEKMIRNHQAELEALIRERTGHLYQSETERTRLLSIIEFAHDLISMVDLNGNLLYLNQAGRQLLGIAPDDDLANATLAVHHPPEAVHLLQNTAFPAVLANGVWEGECDFQTRAGQHIHTSLSLSIHDATDGPIISSIARDISERKRTEQILQEQRQDLQIIFDTLHVMIWHLEPHNRIRRINRFAANHAHIAPEIAPGKNVQALYSSQFNDSYYADNIAVMDSGIAKLGVVDSGFYFEGNPGWFQSDKVPYFDENGNVAGLIVFITDITAIKRTEQALRDSESLYQSLVNYLPFSVYRIDREGRLTFVNQALLDSLKLTPESLLGKTAYDFYPHDLDEKYRRDDVHVLRSGDILHLTEEHRHPRTGELLQVEVLKIPVFDSDKQIIGIQGVFWDVSERLRIEKERDLLLHNLKEAQRLVCIGSWELNLETKQLIWSDEIYRMFELSTQTFKPSYAAFLDAIHPDDRQLVNQAYTTALENQASYDITYRLLMSDQRIKYVHERCQISYDKQGKPLCLIGTIQDISERAEMEIALRESRHHLQQAQYIAKMGDFTWDILSGEVTWSSGLYRLLKYPQTEKLDITQINVAIHHPDDLAEVNQWLTDSIAAGMKTLRTKEYRLICRDGEVISVQTNGWIEYHDGQAVKLYGTCLDITARKRIEQKLYAGEIRYRSILNTTSEGCWILDADTRTREVNAALCRMLGYQEEEILGHSPLKFVDEASQAVLSAQLAKIPATEHRQYEIVLCTQSGGKLPVLVSASTLRDQNGKIDGAVAFVTDITTRKQYENELIQARDAAESANRAKSSFLANMSHELRTPLNAVMGYAQILAKSNGIDPEYQRMAQTINHSGNHLLTLLNDILDLSKIEAGRYELHYAACRPESLLYGLTDLFRVRAAQKGLTFKRQMATSLPSSVETDERRVRQILLNLLGNAVKFTSQGEVRLCCNYYNEKLYFVVSDSGSGIPPSLHEDIFNPFQQAGDEHYKSQGTGLGLTISHKLAQMMGGSLSVDSMPGHGSSFYLCIPAKTIPPSVQQSPNNRKSSVIGYTRRNNDRLYHILIVDDNAANRQFLEALLKSVGFVVNQADSGEMCLEILASWPADLVLMDIKMPGLNGLETTLQIRTFNKKIPIIAVTAGAFEDNRTDAMKAGCTDYLAKPLDESELFACIGKHLDLTWQYAETVTISPSSTPIESSLSAEQRATLLHIMKHGEITKLLNYLETLCKQSNASPEIKELYNLARDFKLSELKRRLQPNKSSK